jgi:hypothetical protein
MTFETELDETTVDESFPEKVKVSQQTFDKAAIRNHLELVHKAAEGAEGAFVLCAYGESPQGRKETFPIERFAVGNVDEMTDAVMRLEGRQYANVYLGLHVMRHDLKPNARGGLKDIVAVLGLVADFDGGNGEEGIKQMATRLPPSFVIETSPGNAQAVLLFDAPIKPEDAAPIAEAFKTATPLSDTGTKDIAHVWRVPGCLNWPNKKKADEGRPLAPASVRILQSGQALFSQRAAHRARGRT